VVASGSSTTFLSYSRDDSGFVVNLARDLKAAGAVIWMDKLDIAPGRRWDGAIQDALASCTRLLLVLSPSSVASTNVLDEVNFALENQKTVIPVLYVDCEVPFRLRRLQYVDLKSDYDRGFQELLRTLHAPEGDHANPSTLDVPAPPYPATKPGNSSVSPDGSKIQEQGRAALLGGSATKKASIGAAALLLLGSLLWFGVKTLSSTPPSNRQSSPNVVVAPNPTPIAKADTNQRQTTKPERTKDQPLNPPVNSSERIDTVAKPVANLASNPEYRQLQQRLVETQEQAKAATGFWAPIKADLARSNQSLRPQIQKALGTLARSTENAGRSLRGGDLTGARASLDAADQELKILQSYENE